MRKFVFIGLMLSLGLIQAAFPQDTGTVVPPTRGYLLGPGDELTVRVLGEKDFDFDAIVDENGNIEVPFFDKPVSAMCKSQVDLRNDVTKLLSKYLRTPQVSVNIKDRKSRPPTTITGAVRNPQQVILMRKYRLSELIAVAGGDSEDSNGMVQVIRQSPPMCGSPQEIAEWKAQSANTESIPMRIYTLSSVRTGLTDDSNPVIYPGDIVSVEKAKPVYIIGEVRGGQGGILIKDNGLRLTNAIAMVGGVNADAKTKDIKIYRQKPNSIEKEVISANLDLIKQNKQTDVMLEPYDVIEVDKVKENFGKQIMKAMIGAVPGMATGGMMTGITRILY